MSHQPTTITVKSRDRAPLPEFLARDGVSRVPHGTRITEGTLRLYGRHGFDEFGAFCDFHAQQGWLYIPRGRAWVERMVWELRDRRGLKSPIRPWLREVAS